MERAKTNWYYQQNPIKNCNRFILVSFFFG